MTLKYFQPAGSCKDEKTFVFIDKHPGADVQT